MELEIVYLSPHELTPYENNTRKHNPGDIDGIKKSIQDVGFRDPIGIWGKNNLIVEGHGRQLAAIELGMEKVPCIRLDDMTEEQRKEYAIRHNRSAEMSEWDFGKLEEELAALDIAGIDMSDLKFDLEALNGGGIAEFDIREDEVPEPSEEPKSKRGDIYQLGRHRLMCGDSTDAEAWEKLMDGEKADIGFTSPPYNAGFGANLTKDNGRASKYANDDDNKTLDEYRAFINAFISATAKHVDYQFINIQMLANNKKALAGILYDNKDRLADVIIWDKTRSQPAAAENVLNSEFEFIFVFSDNGTRAIGKKPFHGTLKNIIHIGNVTDNEYSKIHNATFTVELAAWFVSNFSVESVVDAFGGTGTTLIACEQLDRDCYMMELEPKYVDVIIERWENMTGEKAVLLNE